MTSMTAYSGPLAIELATYDRLMPKLLSDEGKYALIAGDRLIDCYLAYEDALKAGYREVGLMPFLVKRISGTESAVHFTRDIAAKCLTTHSQ